MGIIWECDICEKQFDNFPDAMMHSCKVVEIISDTPTKNIREAHPLKQGLKPKYK